MNTPQNKMNFREWFSAEEMNMNAHKWLSELEFAIDEHLFFEDLVKSFTMQLLATKKFSENKEIMDAISQSQKRNTMLVETIQKHRNKLDIIVDGIDQLKDEELYKKEHNNLKILVNDFLLDYRELKNQLFTIIRSIRKNEKQNMLLNKR